MKKILASVLAVTMLSTAALGMAEGATSPTNEPAAEQAVQESRFSFADIADQDFTFCSGVGGWSTDMYINADGSFYGSFVDSEMGDSGDEYPDGTVYGCAFHGQLSYDGMVNDYTVRLKIDSLELDEGQVPSSIEDGIRYVTSETPYGFDQATELLLYLPGAPVSELPEGFISWSHLNELPGTFDELPYYGLYNEAGDCGFVSMDDLTMSEPADLTADELQSMVETDEEHNTVTLRYPVTWSYAIAGGEESALENLTDGEISNGRFCVSFCSANGRSGDAQISFGPTTDPANNTVTASFHVNEDGSIEYKGLTLTCADGSDARSYVEEDNETIVVLLEGNATTGYEWTFVPDNSGAVELAVSEYLTDDSDEGMTGVGGTWLFALHVTDKNATEASPMFVYGRSWEDGSAMTYTLHVNLNHGTVSSVSSELTIAE